jgi:hypothetical protein
MKSYCLYPIPPVSGKKIAWEPMKIPGGLGRWRNAAGNCRTPAINYVIIKPRSAVDKEGRFLLLYILYKSTARKAERIGPGYGPTTFTYFILLEDLDMPGFNGMGPWGRGRRRDSNWRNYDRGSEYGFPGYGPAMWWDIPAARSYATPGTGDDSETHRQIGRGSGSNPGRLAEV